MRYEAKHQYFKHLASTMGNYINICYSLAMRHQCLQSYLHASGAIIHTDDQEVGNGMFIDKICSSSHMNHRRRNWGGGRGGGGGVPGACAPPCFINCYINCSLPYV